MAHSSKITNKGGPAARQGFKYQDHVAVQLLLRMFTDRYAVRVECETADDIVYVSESMGTTIYEYIQVKTTESNHKWSYTEITSLENKKKESSLIQKSLLCDINGGDAKFRIVSKRDVFKDLQCLTLEYHQRTSTAEVDDLGSRLLKKFKSTISISGRTLNDWAKNCVWQISGTIAHLEAINLKNLFAISEQLGAILSHSQVTDIYQEILELADAAAVANAVSESDKKRIEKGFFEAWLSSLLSEARKKSKSNAKPYIEIPKNFLLEFHSHFESTLTKGVRGFDVQYDFEEWRSEEFANHLISWLPEFTLRASELTALTHQNAIELTTKAYSKITTTTVEQEQLIAEIILHSLLRTTLNSEPIACKVFYTTDGTISKFGNAHIVHNKHPIPDELWLGQSKLIPLSQYKEAIDDLTENLESVITKATLLKEKDIIISLREPIHLLPTSQQLTEALERNARLEDFLKVLCFPIMLAYDSQALSTGYKSDYIDCLKDEITSIYGTITSKLSKKIEKIKVFIFLVPIECTKTLEENFRKACGD